MYIYTNLKKQKIRKKKKNVYLANRYNIIIKEKIKTKKKLIFNTKQIYFLFQSLKN